MSASLKTWLYGLFGAEAHFYSVNAQRNCLSAASRGAQHVVGWAARWCSDSLLVKPVEGGDNPRTHGVLRAAGRAACGGRQDAMDLPSLRGFHSPGEIAWRTHRCTICMQVGTCNEDKRVTPLFPLLSSRFSFPRCVAHLTGPLHQLMPGAQRRIGWSECSPWIVFWTARTH